MPLDAVFRAGDYHSSRIAARIVVFSSIVGFLLVSAGIAGTVSAEDLTSTSFTQRGGSFVSAAHPALVSAASVPEFASAGSTLGSALPTQPVGSTADLTTVLPGFWAIVAAAFPNLDIDGDLAQYFLDDDDDGDGLDDSVETGTGVLLSASDTGTSPVLFDTDGDGTSDGEEVLLGSDPNDPLASPTPVPILENAARLILASYLMFTAVLLARKNGEHNDP